jgi:pyruvate dehydrogenase E1 component
MNAPQPHDIDVDPLETAEWIESFDSVVERGGPARAQFLMRKLVARGIHRGAVMPFTANTPYINTIPVHEQPPYPGDRELERKIKSIIRWNAMAMVVRANRTSVGIGGHISTYASAATLYEVAFNHYFRGRGEAGSGDHVYFQGHAAPGIYARAYLEGRLGIEQLHNFRRELADGGGLPSYPHPWLKPDFWEFPTVSMGLAPISAIYQARFNRYLLDRGLIDTSRSRVWAFLGDGETDEPETLGAITLASREHLDNLTFVINCNLQRLDGPVRGNGKIVQQLEAAFRGAGWNVIKVLWGSRWDGLLENDESGHLVRRMEEILDGEMQRFSAENGNYVREHFFGKYPETAKLVADYSDEEIFDLRRGGHDPVKVNAAYDRATRPNGSPTVILAHTIKGYGMGEAGEGRNITHQQKKLNEDELRQFRDRFEIPVSDEELPEAPFYKPPENSDLIQYLKNRRHDLGGFVPSRVPNTEPLQSTTPRVLESFRKGSGDRAASTTMALVRMLARLLDDPVLGPRIVPIVPDEARTFGMDALFRKYGIYAHQGQLYEPVDSHLLLYYREAKDGQIFEEGITEAGSMASFTAAGTAYASHGLDMIPFFLFYSMFGFQRVGDSIWAAADMRTKGFLIGCTAGRTTLAGEGLQHQDGHSLLMASTVPNCISYDPAFGFEAAVIVEDGLRRMYTEREDVFYYMTVENEPYVQPAMPADCEDGILKGMYLYQPTVSKGNGPTAQLFGSGPILNESLRAQQMLADDFGVKANVWSVTSYTELKRDAMRCRRWNLRHPDEPRRSAYVLAQLEGHDGPVVAASDYVRALVDQIAPWLGTRLTVLGTDGFGRSDARADLRHFFEVDAASIAYATVVALTRDGTLPAKACQKAAERYGVDPDKPDPMML